MQFAPSEEQRAIREAARSFLAGYTGSGGLRSALALPGGYDRQLWQQMAGELGWAGLAIPERFGGAGLGWVELCILQEEQGRQLTASPYFSTVALAAPLVRATGSETQCEELLGRIAAGGTQIACAVTGTEGHAGVDGVTVQLRPAGAGGFVLEGTGDFVIHADSADLLLVLARAPGSRGGQGLSAAVIAADAAGVTISPHVMLDLTRPMSRVSLAGVAVTREALLGAEASAGAAIQHGLQRAQIALAAEALGGAERVLEMTVEYVKQREQFGRPVGSFQAIKHRLADMMVQVEAARSASWYAACVADEQEGELAEAAAIAKSYCCDAFYDCAATAIQLHGGIGFTWEHDAHLYFKRARASATLLGTPAWQREQLVRVLGMGGATVPVF
ncbi:MAG TPA: acyl-CoA dehydrogenase family protein [Steroidobacteraceae bacterium]|jgi:alkylation response protein AidB-like acyl-CoA dehydrogenase